MQTDQTFLSAYLIVKGHTLLKITQGPRGAVMHFPDTAIADVGPFNLGAQAPALELLQAYRRLMRTIHSRTEATRG